MRVEYDGKRNVARVWLTDYEDGDVKRCDC